jgi:hypothetical protein
MLTHFIQFPPGGYGTCIEEEEERNEGAIMPDKTSEL